MSLLDSTDDEKTVQQLVSQGQQAEHAVNQLANALGAASDGAKTILGKLRLERLEILASVAKTRD